MYAIRQATVNDVTSIKHIAHETWWPAYCSILSEEQINYMLSTIYAAEKIIHQIEYNEQTYLILSDGGEDVAFAAYSPRIETPEIYKLHKLYCLPKVQGKGYGKILINEVSRQTLHNSKHILELNVNRQNQAKLFYEKQGFSVAYKEDIPIGPYWMNDYVMRKELL
jgi:GNAT superfamily N-acetyltransferase